MASEVSGQDQGDAQRPAPPLALYRRYRPATFAEVKGQDHVTEPLRQALRSGRVHHAYLLSGPRGCGKTTSARILARSLNCEQGPTPDPCGVCSSCVALAAAGPGSIDVIEIDAASHGGVDDARDLRERAFYAPVSGRFKIYIIDEAHMVTGGGFNALLKLVEEPPPHVKFVFATTEPEKVIATIRSRTHHYPFRLVPPGVLREHFEQILASEGVAYQPAVLPLVIRSAAGSVRDGLSVLDQLIAGADAKGLTYDRAVALLGYSDDSLLDEVTEAFAKADGAAVFRAIDRVVEAGLDPRRFGTDLLDRLRDLIVLAAVPDAGESGLIDAPPDRLDQLRGQAESFSQGALTRAAEVISAGLVEMRGATSPRLLLELMCAQVLLPPAEAADQDLIARLDRLERKLADVGRDQQRQAPAASSQQAAAGPPARESAAAPSRPAPSRPAQSPPPRRPETPQPRPATSPVTAEPPTSPAAGAAAPVTAGPPGQVDADLLRGRWPDILRAVGAEKRVAGILLRGATPAAFADGVLTLAFEREGEAKGFVSGGYDKELGVVLADMFGIKPKIMTGTSAQPHMPPASPDAEHGGQRRAASAQPARPNGRQGAGQARQQPPAEEAEPDPDDAPAPAELTGMGLIERELGGRVIEEIGE